MFNTYTYKHISVQSILRISMIENNDWCWMSSFFLYCHEYINLEIHTHRQTWNLAHSLALTITQFSLHLTHSHLDLLTHSLLIHPIPHIIKFTHSFYYPLHLTSSSPNFLPHSFTQLILLLTHSTMSPTKPPPRSLTHTNPSSLTPTHLSYSSSYSPFTIFPPPPLWALDRSRTLLVGMVWMWLTMNE